MKKYIKPNIRSIGVGSYNILVSSNNKANICDAYCKLWHICRDRELGKLCNDFKMKEL